MQNRGAIRLLAIALALVSLYQLSFTFVSQRVKNKAEDYAQGDYDKRQAYLDSMAGEGVYNFLWLKDYTFREVQERELNLGLDLKGGMNVVLQVSVADVIKSMANYSSDSTFIKALQLAKEKRKESQQDFVTLFGESFNEIDPNGRLVTIFRTRELQDRINNDATNEEVLQVIRNDANAAIDNAFNVLRTRINQFGVSQPNIQQLETKGRILVELPGVKDPERVRTLLQRSAKLQFWETYQNAEIFPYLREANNLLKDEKEASKGIDDDQSDVPGDAVEDAGSDASLTEGDTTEAAEDAETDLLDEMEQDTATSEEDMSMEQFKDSNPLFGLLRPSTNRNGELLQGSAIGVAHFSDTAKINDILQRPKIRSLFPVDAHFRWTVKSVDQEGEGEYHQLVALRASTRDGRPALGGDVITNARADFGRNQAEAEVSMSMNGEGTKKWARITKENVGNQIAIVLDNKVYSFPVVNQEITGGSSTISGDFSIAEAKDLANVLKSGKLPAPAHIIQEDVVGPSLGEEAIQSGLTSFIIAFIVVMFYMIFYYNKAGFVSDLALIANIFFIFGVLASLGAVLTLPGIAGIVLTIGMSVDANVLIYDRIREELEQGKGVKLAVKDGYRNAYSAIFDANLTTLITAIILGYFGKGPIQGFATTLGIGILTSLFSAIFITRLVFTYMLETKKSITYSTNLTRNAFQNTKFNFLGIRKIMYVVSGLILLVSIGSLVGRGLNFGVDFEGGRSYVVRFNEKVSTERIRSELSEVFDQEPIVKTYGEENQVKITTDYLIDQEGEEVDEKVETALYQGIKPIIGNDVNLETFLDDYRMSSQKVGPTIADDIKTSAWWALSVSLVFIFLYIFGRFRNWRFGLGAVAAVFHDAIIVLGIFSLLHGVLPFSLEVDQAFIAAILTVIGYSINDTVVVFDRIREYAGLYKKRSKFEIVNKALNGTLSRTFSTSLSTFVVLLTIFIFGGLVIRGFVFAILIGVLVGTYSSLFIASPLTYDIGFNQEEVSKPQKSKMATKTQAASAVAAANTSDANSRNKSGGSKKKGKKK